MLAETEMNAVAVNLVQMVNATGITHADQIRALRRASELLYEGQGLCEICEMLIPLRTDGMPDVFSAHRANCGLPCVPPSFQTTPSTQNQMLHRGVRNCPYCSSHQRIRRLIIVPPHDERLPRGNG